MGGQPEGLPALPMWSVGVFTGSSRAGWCRQKLPLVRQQRLKQPPGAAGARVVASQFFGEVFVAVDDAVAFLDVGFRGEAFLTLARDLETTPGFVGWTSWWASCFCGLGGLPVGNRREWADKISF